MLVNKRTVCLKFCLNEIIFFCVSENSLLRDVSMLMSVGLKLIFYEKNLFNKNNGSNNCIYNYNNDITNNDYDDNNNDYNSNIKNYA